jgi:aminoglycoside phosphotransferase (APT) family kinase protein
VASRRLRHEAEVARGLPAAALHPGVTATGVATWGEWSVVPIVAGLPLADVWPRLSATDRRRAIADLSGALTAYHRCSVSPVRWAALVRPFAGNLDEPHPVLRIGEVLAVLRQRADVDRGLVEEAATLLVVSEASVARAPRGLVHGDPHFENVLWHDGRVSALLDAEYARPALLDVDVDVILRFCEAPTLHTALGARTTSREDYRDVAGWLAEDLPHVFGSPDHARRRTAVALAYDLRSLALDHRDSTNVRDLPAFHPAVRIRRLLDGDDAMGLLTR